MELTQSRILQLPAVRSRRSPLTERVIREAMQRKELALAVYEQQRVLFCPHALAESAGRRYVLAFLLMGVGELRYEDWTSPTRWRWLPIERLTDVMRHPGQWLSAPAETRPALPDAVMLMTAE